MPKINLILLKKILFFAFPILATFMAGCSPSEAEIAEGKRVAERSCGGCHAFPDASLLSKKTWKNDVLPMMAVFMGVSKEIAKSKHLTSKELTFRAKTQTVTDKEWQAIKNYYLEASPETLPKPAPQTLKVGRQFGVEHVKLPAAQLPNITHVAVADNTILACDELNKTIWQVSPQGQVLGGIPSSGTISDISFNTQNDMFVTYIGTSVQPTLLKKGFIEKVNAKTGVSILAKELYRPVQSKVADLDGDGKNEIVVCEYGLMDGSLSLLKEKNGVFERQVIEQSAGAIDVKIIDFDNDGDRDILTLYAQGNERLMLYNNDGKANFSSKQLLQFPPIYGSSSFELADLNGDRKLDVVYTAGDNADYSMILKPYHGLYVFEQQADETFKKKYFFAANGAYKTAVADFDSDGDTDVAMIGFYATYNNKNQEDFVYFDNQSGILTPQTFQIEHLGRWLTMTVADLDQDNDSDIVLGSHPLGMFPGGLRKEWKENSGVVILRNSGKK